MTTKSDDVKLIGAWASPFVWRARVALNFKSVKFESIEETMGPKSQLLLESNPVYKKIPVLIHAGKPISESLIIMQYIDETWTSGSSILPSDPYDRAIARFWAYYFDDKLSPTIRSISVAQGDEKKKLIKELGEGIVLVEDALKKISKGKDYFGGDQIGYLDIVFGSIFPWLRVVETLNEVKLVDEATTPGLVNWGEKYPKHDVVKDVLPEHEKLIEYAKFVIARVAASTASTPN
ncbi:hypothetical protein TanjilG_11104 [Lupinus angustifolius]|uniref:Glutathione S-transferase n=1 Tax=Lupinus angustifolius TaxID=3871 RepID=A0A394DBA7_LUPAN|nr:PREDICTED: glutathione S-transferase U17-like [Lupinus angustifolius]OIW20413.1 hypothetical protein TanjilG_11104 [Lupinus angustifolius]